MSISGGGGNDDFFLKIRVFLKTSHPYLSKKKKFAKQMTNAGVMAKSILFKKVQKMKYSTELGTSGIIF